MAFVLHMLDEQELNHRSQRKMVRLRRFSAAAVAEGVTRIPIGADLISVLPAIVSFCWLTATLP
jgi:hypothetical protein